MTSVSKVTLEVVMFSASVVSGVVSVVTSSGVSVVCSSSATQSCSIECAELKLSTNDLTPFMQDFTDLAMCARHWSPPAR